MKRKISLLVGILFWFFNAKATMVKSIGVTGDYTSITAAWNAIPTPISEPWILELKSDYNPAAETFPINLTTIAGASAVNTITIRPKAGATGLILGSSSATDIFKFNGVSYVIVDGRPGGIGTRDLTIQNTQTTANTHAIQFSNNASDNRVQYCLILGSSFVASVSNLNPQNNTVIQFVDAGGGSNCDNNTLSDNFISKAGSNRPASLIAVSGTGTSTAIDGLILTNNELSDFNVGALYSTYPLSDLTFTGNSLFQTATWTSSYSALYGIYAINSSNGALDISDNYVGGQTTLCGGSAMTIVSTSWNRPFYGFKVSSYNSTCQINGNTFQNITTSGGGNTQAGNYLIDVDGTSTYQIGTTGNGNLFGSMTGTASLATTGIDVTGYRSIMYRATGTGTIQANNLGGIYINSASNSFIHGIEITSVSTVAILYNTFGGTVSNSIDNPKNGEVYFTYMNSTGNYTVSNNSFQNITINGFTGSKPRFIYLDDNGSLLAEYNSFSNVTNTSNSINYFFYANTAGSVVVANNTVGGTTTNNISNPSGNRGFTCFYGDGGGSFTFNNNTFQQVLQTGTNSPLSGITITSGTLTADGNTFKNLTGPDLDIINVISAGTNTISNNSIQSCTSTDLFYGITTSIVGNVTINGNSIGGSNTNDIILGGSTYTYGIKMMNSSGTFTISGNTIQNFKATNTTTSDIFYGIWIDAGSGNVIGNTIKDIQSMSHYEGAAITGIRVETGGNTISQNTISHLSTSEINTTYHAYGITGIHSDPLTGETNLIMKNKISGLGAAGSSQTDVTGIQLSGAGNHTLYNNVILLDNGDYSTKSNSLTGIHISTSGAKVLYHNTVKIFGTKSSQSESANTYCVYNFSGSALDMQNNLFQNTRSNSGTSGTNYAVYFNSTPSSLTNDYNYMQASGNGGSIGVSIANNNNTGTVLDLDVDGVPTNATSSDVENTGTNLFAIVPDDFNGAPRATPNPWRGAYEAIVTPNPGTDGTVTLCSTDTPVNLFDYLGGTPTNGGTWSGPSTLTGGDVGTFDPITNPAGTYVYTNGGTSANVVVTVNTPPAVAGITGTTEICVGELSVLANTTPGGTWISASSGTVTIDASGEISGVAGGTSLITYSVTQNGCTTDETILVTVGTPPSVAPITGGTALCENTQITLTDVTIGGIWSSASTSIATIDAQGVVSGISEGVSEITYSVTQNGCTASQTVTITVNPSPEVAPITGEINLCEGATETQLQCATIGGIWSVSDPSIATVDDQGLISIVSTGIVTVTYSVTQNGCTTDETTDVTISEIPNQPIVSNDTSYCSTATFAPMLVSGNGGTFTWYGDQDLSNEIGTGSEYVPENTMGTSVYYVTESNNGCLSTPATIEIIVMNCEIEIPTAFTPDHDGTNDSWELEGIDTYYPKNTVQIFNRWGGLLYQSSEGNYELNPWDGTYKGTEMPVASYYFIINYNNEDKDVETGTVTIVKKKN